MDVDSSTWRALVHFVDDLRVIFNRYIDHLEPWQIIFYTFSAILLIEWLRKILKYEEKISVLSLVSFF